MIFVNVRSILYDEYHLQYLPVEEVKFLAICSWSYTMLLTILEGSTKRFFFVGLTRYT